MLALKTGEMARLDQKDMVHERRHGFEPAAWLHAQIHRGRVRDKPGAPLATFLVGVGEELVEREDDHKKSGAAAQVPQVPQVPQMMP